MEKIVNNTKYLKMRDEIRAQCERTHIWKRGAQEKKKKNVVDSISLALINSDLSYQDVKNLINDINEGSVIENNILFRGGNLWEAVNKKWLDVAKNLFLQISPGIGTPNAASGQGELMFLFLGGGQVRKPNRGDLFIEGKLIELKGNSPRISGQISGYDFRVKTLEIAEKYKLKPNDSKKSGIEGVEIEKRQWLGYWKKQMEKLSLKEKKDFINDWLGCIDDKDHYSSIPKILIDGDFNLDGFQREILKILFSIHRKSNPFDIYAILGNGENVKVIPNDIDKFSEMVENREISLGADYFRIAQKGYPIGWYIN